MQYTNATSQMEECQSAYQENFPTETALLKVKTDILDAIDKKEAMCLVMLDLSAAFNTVNHHLLLNRLKYKFGVCDLALAWLKSYLTNRTQQVVIQNEDGHTAQSAKSHSHKEYLKDLSSDPLYLICLWPLWVSYVEKKGCPFKDMQMILKTT